MVTRPRLAGVVNRAEAEHRKLRDEATALFRCPAVAPADHRAPQHRRRDAVGPLAGGEEPLRLGGVDHLLAGESRSTAEVDSHGPAGRNIAEPVRAPPEPGHEGHGARHRVVLDDLEDGVELAS